MKLALASDHGGYLLKNAISQFLESRQISIVDLGVDDDQSVDYPDYAAALAEQVSQGKVDAGILFCGTGIGMAITANKFRGVRAAVVCDVYSAQMSKEHNNANVIALGGRTHSDSEAIEIIQAWLDAKFSGDRHQRRLDKIAQIEAKNMK